MCRLFGLTAGDQRVSATFWLLDDANSLVKQSHANPDGAGLGTFDDEGHPRIDKQPLAAFEDAAFHREARERRSTTFVAHVRYATGTPLTQVNTHPFEMDGRLFAHNGAVQELDKVEAELGEAMKLVQGQTDSERVFALITRNIRAGMEVEDAIVAAAQWLADNVPVIALNVIVTTESDLWALRYPETDELWLLEKSTGGSSRHRSGESTRLEAEELASTPHVLVASEKLDDDSGWRMIPSGTVVHIGPDLTVHERLALPNPPRRRPASH